MSRLKDIESIKIKYNLLVDNKKAPGERRKPGAKKYDTTFYI